MKIEGKQRLMVRNLASASRRQSIKIFKLELEASLGGRVRMTVST